MSRISEIIDRLNALKDDKEVLENELKAALEEDYSDFEVEEDGSSGNAGDWAEIYVFYRIMEQGKIKTAKNDNGNMNVIYDSFLPVLKIIREESGLPLEYYTSNEMNGSKALNIYYAGLDNPLVSCKLKDFKDKADELLDKIKSTKSTSSMKISTQAEYLNSIYIRKIKSPAQEISASFGGKSDITMEIIQQDNLHVPVGFSIKSGVRGNASLINASKANDTIFEVKGCNDALMNEINGIDSRFWIVDRTKRLLSEDSVSIKFDRYGSKTFYDNLRLIADNEPAVVAYALLYSNGEPEDGEGSNRGMEDAIASLIAKDPLNIGADMAPLYYKKRMKDLLFEFACGMQSDTPWDTDTKIQGGYIFVTQEGDVMAYYASNQDSYKNWLVTGTRFDMPSAKRHKTENGPCCGYIHKEKGKYYYTLSLNVKFKK